MQKYAVITGDIVKSKNIKDFYRQTLIDALKNSFEEINAQLLQEKELPFEIYRGDSFQAVIKQTHFALEIGLMLRAKVRSLTKFKGKDNAYWDTRLAIGIGNIDFFADRIIESDGEAFRFSGNVLDKMKKAERLKIHTPWEEINNELTVECAFADAIINRWSVNQSEVIYRYLLKRETQKKLAERFNISQPALRKRLVVSGSIDSINVFINRYRNLIQSKLL